MTIDESIRQFLINEGLAEVKDDKLIITKAPRKSIVPTIILFVALAFVIGISVYQAMYIWRFSSGEFEKPTSYAVEDDEEEDDDAEYHGQDGIDSGLGNLLLSVIRYGV